MGEADLISLIMTWTKILAQAICMEVKFLDSGENFMDVNYKSMTDLDLAVARPISEPQ